MSYRNNSNTFTLKNVTVEGDVEISMDDVTENLDLSDILDAYDDSQCVVHWMNEKADDDDLIELVIDKHDVMDGALDKLCERAKGGDDYAQALIDEHFPTPEPELVVDHRATSVEQHESGDLWIVRAGSDESFQHPTEGSDKPVVIGFAVSLADAWHVQLRLSGTTTKYTTTYESDAMRLVKALVAWDDVETAQRKAKHERDAKATAGDASL